MDDNEQLRKELEEIKQELATLTEGSRAYKALAKQKAELEAKLRGSGAIAQGDKAQAVGQDGIGIGGGLKDSALVKGDGNQVFQNSNVTIVVTAEGAKEFVGPQPVEMKAKLRKTALGRYLEYVIAHNRYLQLQGIRSGGKLVNIELEQIYITLRATAQRAASDDEWLRHEAEFAPGELRKQHLERPPSFETVAVKVEEALTQHSHMVVLGDPGSGKTTLLRYLALLYGRDLAQGTKEVRKRLDLDESGHLPILLQLRQIGAFLKAHRPKDDGTEGCGLLLDFLFETLKGARLELPADFFDEYLNNGTAVVLLDGLDEVADPALRARVARLAEAFTLAYPACRFVVTSRIVGYSGPARLGGDYATTTVRDFTLADIETFLTHWHRLVAVGQLGPGEDAETYAAGQTAQLMQAVRNNERIRELAINPLMLTVIALVHRDRVKLPDRRAELYAEAVDVLLGKWEEAKNMAEIAILDDKPFDAGDKRLRLQKIALTMHEHQQKEISLEDLRRLLGESFGGLDEDQKRRAVERFQKMIEERTGLLVARGEGVYAFSHLTFQEYLAALAVAGRDDYIEYSLKHSGEAWWREVLLLEAGFLSTQSEERTTNLVRALAENKKEPAPYHNLVLASECIRDVGGNRIDAIVDGYVKNQLRKALDIPQRNLNYFERRIFGKTRPNWMERRAQAIETLVRAGAGYWYPPYGEPEWVTIPAGEFWMGSENGRDNEKPVHKLFLPEYQIARVPVTNAQYALFVKTANYKAPGHFEEGRPPRGKESHPVADVSWYDAVAYCEWLSKVTGKHITLPSEAEWEKAAKDPIPFGRNVVNPKSPIENRSYPWSGEFDSSKCNTKELGLRDTTPVGIFLEGASPYGVLDMSGNIWEWTRSLFYHSYPYKPEDGRERLYTEAEYHSRWGKESNGKDIVYGLRGGSFILNQDNARCAYRGRDLPDSRYRYYGFRVVVVFSRASR